MGDISMDTVAERQLELRTESGTIPVVASLGMPRKVGNDEWVCACITRFADDIRSVEMHGGDSMQALQLAMVTLDLELMRWAERLGGTLLHFDEPFNSILEDSGMRPRISAAHTKPDAT